MSSFRCAACGHAALRWFGRCPSCGEWGAGSQAPEGGGAVEVVTLATTRGEARERSPSGIPEVDRVLGGGFVAGQVALLAGEPGIGKSTLILQIIDSFVRSGHPSLLASGEESLHQVALRAQRLGTDPGLVRALASVSLQAVLATAGREHPRLLVVDSIQTLEDADLDQAPGSVAQVRACTQALVRLAKESGVIVLIVGHVTKEGSVAGPKTLEHAVDSVLMLEGDRSGPLRLLRATKNRFGSCDETGVFTMGAAGLIAVDDPSSMLLQDRLVGIPGSVVFCALEGNRPVLVEVQALVGTTGSIQPKRVTSGIDPRRIDLILGVLSQRAGLSLAGRDVFVAAAGGIGVKEPGVDLAIALALGSAILDVAVDPRCVAVGEVGLSGGLRRVQGLDRRLSEARRLGFDRAVVAVGSEGGVSGIETTPVETLQDALRAVVSGSVPAAG